MLRDHLPDGSLTDPDRILDRFLAGVAELGLTPYRAQEEALLELMAGRHVVLSTPTGSGKSLVAQALHFKALCEGRRSFYTAPAKALVSEKFFALCDQLGPQRVGMMTGDASVNWAAPVVCCTAEVLANMALRQGEATDAPYVVMDEFHYYADPERGSAWQIPLLALPRTTFLILSATLGNTDSIERALHARSGREVAHVHSDERPVPLDWEYRETPLHETVEDLLAQGKAPVYVVHFTQREAAEQAQALTSARVADRDQRRRIAETIGGFRFDSPYGKDLRRFLRHGIGLHHAGLLPRYRLLVEQLAQQGMLRVICGTDTLGVGVNVPIRSVLLSRLCKFDGERVRLLSVREFKQIAGRAGRKGFDEQGSVVCQAPEPAIERRREAQRAARPGGRRRRTVRRAMPRGLVPWNRATFERLVARPPEKLESRFPVTHGMVLSLLQREADAAPASGYRAVLDLIEACHEDARRKRRLRRDAATVFRSLRRAQIVSVERGRRGAGARVRVDPALQKDFSLHHTLSLYVVDTVSLLDREADHYALDVLGVVEAILEDPRPILEAQREHERRELLARLKAEGVPYEERRARLEQVTHPQPNAEFLHATFDSFVEKHPWVGTADLRPKSVAREMLERYEGFQDFVRRYRIQRVEGLLLRHLSQVHDTLARTVPEAARSDEVHEILGFLRALLARVDSSLVEEWESLMGRGRALAPGLAPARPSLDPDQHPRAFRARVRAEMRQLVRVLAAGDYEEAARCVRQDPEDPWDAERFECALGPFYEEYERIVFNPRARAAHHTSIKRTGLGRWDVTQVLVDARGDDFWCVEGEIELSGEPLPEGPLLRVRRIGT